MDKLSLEERIKAELVSYAGKMGIYVNDLKGNTIKIGIDEEFETASSIKAFILADLFKQVEEGTEPSVTYITAHGNAEYLTH